VEEVQDVMELAAGGHAVAAAARALWAHVVEASEHELLDGAPELEPRARRGEKLDGSEGDLVLEHEHVELDVVGVLPHGHVQYEVVLADGRRPRHAVGGVACAGLAEHQAHHQDEAAVQQQHLQQLVLVVQNLHGGRVRVVVGAELIAEAVALQGERRDVPVHVEAALVLQVPHERELGVVGEGEAAVGAVERADGHGAHRVQRLHGLAPGARPEDRSRPLAEVPQHGRPRDEVSEHRRVHRSRRELAQPLLLVSATAAARAYLLLAAVRRASGRAHARIRCDVDQVVMVPCYDDFSIHVCWEAHLNHLVVVKFRIEFATAFVLIMATHSSIILSPDGC